MAEYRGSLLEILTVALAGVSLVVVVLRGIARYRIAKVFDSTDILLPLSLVFALAQSVFVRLALSNGLGTHIADLGDNQVTGFQKLIYASNLAYQLVLSTDQVVVLLLIKSVEPQLPVRIGCNVLFAFIAIYSAAALAIQAFQCSLPEPWNVAPDRCVNRAFFTGFISANILIDVLTLILPIVMVCKLKTSRDKKTFVCILFSARICVPAVTVFQALHLHSVLNSEDVTWDIVPYQTWIQVIMNLSLITACLPSLGRMMWELWAFGSGLRTSTTAKSSESKDFGHELGLPQGQAGLTEKSSSPNHDSYTKVREVRSFDSASTVVEPQRTLPALPRRTTSRFRPVRRKDHHYRRPVSLSRDNRYLPAMEFSALDMPSPTVMIQRHKFEQDLNTHDHFPFPNVQPPAATTLPPPTSFQFPQQRRDHLPPPTHIPLPPTRSPTLPQVTDSYYEADLSSIDIDSYYLMSNSSNYNNNDPNNMGDHIPPPYEIDRTEMVLQHMIDELKSQNSSFYSRVQSSVYSAPRMQSSIYSAPARTESPQWPMPRTASPLYPVVRTQRQVCNDSRDDGGWI